MTSRGWLLLFVASAIFTAGAILSGCSGDDGGTTPTAPAATATATPTAPPEGPGPSAAASPSATVPADLPPLALEQVAAGFRRPTFVTHAGDGSGRLFVVEKPGTIRIVEDGAVRAEPFLDITSRVTSSGNEQGLLGLAFHPDFDEDGRFFVAYTATGGGANTLAEYRADPATGRADPSSGRVLISIPDRYSNHNGGMVAFGPDGYLYFSTGDGGSQGDPERNGQSLGTLLAKLLRIDVDSGDPYGIPPSNPFVSTQDARPEIWAYGFRNPWRFSFDRDTGDLWVGDVGQGKWEEVDHQPASSSGGENYGWSVLEGDECYRPASGCDRSGKVAPVYAYGHDRGCSVTGGYVYRGQALPAAVGSYFFIDYCEGTLMALRPGGAEPEVEQLLETQAGVSSFGEDEAGELYLVGDGDGVLYRLVARQR